MKYYIYRHIRLDKNEPFYIGQGKKEDKHFTKWSSEYFRAYKKRGRSNDWKKITAQAPYEVEILFETDSEELINQKEIEFIKLYGREDLGNGTLVNKTNGGKGMKEFKRSEEWKKKHSEFMKANNPMKGKTGENSPLYGSGGDKNPFFGKKHTEESKKKHSEQMKGRVPWNKGLKGVQVAWNKGIKTPEESINKKIKTKLKKRIQTIGIQNLGFYKYLAA